MSVPVLNLNFNLSTRTSERRFPPHPLNLVPSAAPVAHPHGRTAVLVHGRRSDVFFVNCTRSTTGLRSLP
eukprot:SAG31_NODE_2351_length_5889_cov_1.999482_1_plen_69_part_10